ncbi:MAG: hypothetical protein GX093_12605 [Xanthomonadaceae bacterium]|nr:hypothetical protein [Xanthomonadaceae bacterium]
MGYRINARATHGRPCLEIRDASTGAVRLLWQHPAATRNDPPEDPLARALLAEEALHSLFRELFLLTAKDRLLR